MDETSAQKKAVDELVSQKVGWRVDYRDRDTVYLSRPGKHRGQTLYCQVGPEGKVE